jgi:hypothetical protein
MGRRLLIRSNGKERVVDRRIPPVGDERTSLAADVVAKPGGIGNMARLRLPDPQPATFPDAEQTTSERWLRVMRIAEQMREAVLTMLAHKRWNGSGHDRQ